MTNKQNKQENWEKELKEYEFCCGGDQCDYGDHQEEAKEDMTKIIKQVISTERQRVTEEVREVIEGFKNGQNVIINAVNRSKKSELAEPLLAQNQILRDLLQELNELEKTND